MPATIAAPRPGRRPQAPPGRSRLPGRGPREYPEGREPVDEPRPLPPGAEDALVGAFEAHRNELFSTLYFLLGNREDAQDALQAAFLNCWRARASLPGVRN